MKPKNLNDLKRTSVKLEDCPKFGYNTDCGYNEALEDVKSLIQGRMAWHESKDCGCTVCEFHEEIEKELQFLLGDSTK